MKVLFDSQVFDWQISGGISRYFTEILKRLNTAKDIEVLLEVQHSYNTYIQDTTWLKKKPVFQGINFKGKLLALKYINQQINRKYSNKLLQRHTPDVFHPTYYDPYFLKYKSNIPLVLTVHDLTDEKYNDGSARTKTMLIWKKKLINIADHIITVSDNTKQDVIDYYKVPIHKVTTAHLSASFDKKILIDHTEEKPVNNSYLLFVGARRGYKNFLWFLDEVAPIMIKENISLVIAGGGSLSASEVYRIKQHDIKNKVVHFPHVSDVALQQLYQNALFFIFPSLYEGFGIPVVEAMQCGCPILLSNTSSLPEVGGNAAEYFNPFVQGSLTEMLRIMLNSTDKRVEMIKNGITQSQKFNWDITAEIHKKVYRIFKNN